jgi:hypothetical protein
MLFKLEKGVDTENTNSLKQEGSSGGTFIMFDSMSTVNEIFNKALAYCSTKMGINKTKVIELLKNDFPDAYGYFNYCIAKQVGKVLGKLCKNVKSVYALDHEDNVQEEGINKVDFIVHIIVLVERKTKPVDSLISTLQEALIEHYKKILEKATLEHVLDAHVVDTKDVKNRMGYGALLGSIYQPPICVLGDRLNHS